MEKSPKNGLRHVLSTIGSAADRFLAGRNLGWISFGALLIAGFAAAGAFRTTVNISKTNIQPELGRAFIAQVAPRPWLTTPGDDDLAHITGEATLFGDSLELGPGHQLHQAIRDVGGGRFAVNGGYLRFSASDNSDPRKNGRTYRLEIPIFPGPIVWLLIAIGFAASALRLAGLWGRPAVSSFSAALSVPLWRRALPGMGIGAAGTLAAIRSSGPIMLGFGAPSVALLIGLIFGAALVLIIAWPAVRRDVRAAPPKMATFRAGLWAVLCPAIGVLAYAGAFATGLVTVHQALDGRMILLSKGRMFYAQLPTLPVGLVYDDYTRTRLVSPTHLLENGVEFGLRFDSDAEIADLGAGRYTIAQGFLLFSTKDGSDPRTNGRRYDVVTPALPGSAIFFVSLLAAGLSILLLRWSRTGATEEITPPEASAAGLQPVSVAAGGGGADAVAAATGFMLAMLIAIVLRKGTWGLGIDAPLSGIGLWIAPFVVLVSILSPVLASSSPANVHSRALTIVQTILAVMVIALAGVTPLLDTLLNADSFGSIHYDGSEILAMIHANDSATYLGTAMHVVEKGAMDSIGTNRPLNGTILAWSFWFGAGDLPTVLLCRAIFVAFAVVLAARELAATFGWFCGILFGVFVTSFNAEFLPTGLSEPNGVAFACLGLGLFLRSLRLRSFGLFLAATTMTALALMARPGAMLSIPAVVFFAWSAGSHFGIRPLTAGIATLVAVLPGALASNYLNMTLGAPHGLVLSNFSVVLYGLAAGGKGWTQFSIDHPHISSTLAIYVFAFQKIWADPSLILGVLASEFGKFWPITFEFTKMDLFFALSVLGALAAAFTVRNAYSRLLVAIVVSVWLSSPFIRMDGGYRVFAASIPFWALLSVWPLALLRMKPWLTCASMTGQSTRSTLVDLSQKAGMIGWATAVVCGLIAATPLMFRRAPPEIMTREVPSTCAPGETSVLVRGARTAQITHVVSDRLARSVVPFVRETTFDRYLTINAPDIVSEIGHIPSGSSLAQVIEPLPNDSGRQEFHLIIFRGQDVSFPADRIVEICATPVNARYNGSLFVSQAVRWSERP